MAENASEPKIEATFFKKSLQNDFETNPSKVLACLVPSSCVLINSGRYKALSVKIFVVTWATLNFWLRSVFNSTNAGYKAITRILEIC